MNPDKKTPQEQANYWLVLLSSPFASSEQRLAFEAWLAENPDNQAEWDKARAFWKKFDMLSDEQVALLDKRLSSAGRRRDLKSKRSLRGFFNPWSVPAFACLLLLVWVGIAAWPVWFADYRTAVGEQRSVQLSDGSTVLMNTDTALSVDFTATQRTVTLHGGEAYFKVAKDAERPFDVETDDGRVRALGTAFEVRQLGREMAVTVYEHAVRVVFSQGTTIEALREGELVAVNEGRVSKVVAVNRKQTQAWRDHRLVFRDLPLVQVVAELNRYRPGSIVIVNARLKQHRVTGVFDTREPDKALAVIENTLKLAVYRLPGSLVLLAAR
ncbi:FecR domain-containing protein [Methylomicrobium lacus]|uniref:FecR family protein n=1 Tax=Methylomicrobium lacus TaxID=136992 RepID=UPI0035A8A19E